MLAADQAYTTLAMGTLSGVLARHAVVTPDQTFAVSAERASATRHAAYALNASLVGTVVDRTTQLTQPGFEFGRRQICHQPGLEMSGRSRRLYGMRGANQLTERLCLLTNLRFVRFVLQAPQSLIQDWAFDGRLFLEQSSEDEDRFERATLVDVLQQLQLILLLLRDTTAFEQLARHARDCAASLTRHQAFQQ